MNHVKHSRIINIIIIIILIASSLSAQEKNYKRKLLVGGDKHYPPYEFIDNNGKPDGFCVDIVKAVCEEIGLEPEFHLMEWTKVRKAFEESKLDILEGMASSEERKINHIFAESIIPLEFTFFTRKGDPKIPSLESLSGKKILIENRDVVHDKLIALGFENELVPVGGPNEILRRLSLGEATCGITPRLIGNYIMRTENISNIYSQDTVLFRFDYGFALNKGDTLLLTELNRGIRIIKTKGIYDKIYDKWFGVLKPVGFSGQDIYKYALWILSPILLTIILIYVWSIILKKQVKQKTLELKNELEEKKAIEIKLEEEKELLTTTLKSIGEGVVCTDIKGSITLINHSAQRLLFTEKNPVGMNFDDAFNIRYKSKKREFIKEILQERKIVGITKDITALICDETKKSISLTGSPVISSGDEVLGTVLIITDLSEKIQLEKELNKAQNLEMVGILAGGIAHDFNNLLTAILGNLSLAKMFIDKDNKVYERIVKGESAALRAKDLTHQLLTFSKGGAPVKRSSNIAGIVKDTVDFVLSGSTVKCDFFAEENLWNIEFDEGQMSQVISNIIINASQAMNDNGLIKIMIKNCERADNSDEPVIKRYVSIEISDTGKGIEQSTLDKIFQPYYTTKKSGHGLGLAMVYSIIKNHDGYIDVQSEIGKGTTFMIYLPT